MTNRETKKYKQILAEIVKKFNEPPLENETIEQHLRKKDSIIGDFQKLAIDINAPAHLGQEIRDLRQMLKEAWEKKSDGEKLAVVGAIGKLHYQNILYALQTEMMFNACVFARWSCFWAAIAAIAACLSAILVLFFG
jgi:ATP-dependent protease HslVU (ClpYQ) ATPase subunit